MNFKELKALAESRTKSYKDPIPTDQFISMKGWVIAYAKEDTVLSKHNILSISKKDGKEFPVEQPFVEIPSLKEVFNPDPRISYVTSFNNRGYTAMYWVRG